MKKARIGLDLTRGCLVFSLCLLTACGGGGGGGSNNNTSNPPGNNAGQMVPQDLTDNRLTLTVAGEDRRQVQFHNSETWSEVRDGQLRQGTYHYARQQNGSAATLTLHPASATNASTTLSMNFQSATGGTFTYTSGRTGQGTFEFEQVDLPNEPQPPNEPPQNPNDGLAPTSLDGRTMYGTRTFTSTGPDGQTHKYVFSGQTFEDTDPPEEAQGVYTWNPSGDNAELRLDYMTPSEFQGDAHELEMNFISANHGTFTSVYTRRDGTLITINGTFQFE